MGFDNYIKWLLDEGEAFYDRENGRVVLFNGKKDNDGTYDAQIVLKVTDESQVNIVNVEDVKHKNVTEIVLTKEFYSSEIYIPDNLYPLLTFEDACKLMNLKRLDLYNHVNFDINLIYPLQSLEYLKLRYCEIESISKEIGDLKELKVLNLPHNDIQTIPNEIGELRKLKELDLSDNEIHTLPNEIGELKELKRLCLSFNKITDLTDGNYSPISQLQLLNHLIIHENNISSLPGDIDRLNQLTYFTCESNNLRELPKSITKLPTNCDCRFEDNPLVKPPFQICNEGIEAIRGYFEALDKFKGLHSNRSKIILIGESMAGKTSLCQALVSGKKDGIEVGNRTEGVESQNWKILPEGNDEGLLEAVVIDCAGQQKYTITNKVFMAEGALFLLVVNLDDYGASKENSTYRKDVGTWLSLILLLVKSPAIIIVPTHFDRFESNDEVLKRCRHIIENVAEDLECLQRAKECADDKNSRKMKNIRYHISSSVQLDGGKVMHCCDTLSGELNMIPVSCVDKLSGIADLHKEIIKIMTNQEIMPLIGREIPKVYNELERFCLDMKNNTPVMNATEILDIAERDFEMNNSMAIPALQYLDGVGTILYFTNVKGLDKFVFLDPQWFIDLLKCLFNHNIEKNLIYKFEYAMEHAVSAERFKQDKRKLFENGKLSASLLRCIWSDIKSVSDDDMFYSVIDILHHFHFVIKLENENGSGDLTLLVPWFLKAQIPPEELGKNEIFKVEINCCFKSILFPFPIGLLERFIAESHSLFDSFIPMQHGFLGSKERCRVLSTVLNSERSGKFQFKGNCHEDGIYMLWAALLSLFKILENIFKEFYGLKYIERSSICPSCLSKPSHRVDPQVFYFESWFLCEGTSRYIQCDKENVSIERQLVFPVQGSGRFIQPGTQKGLTVSYPMHVDCYTMKNSPHGFCVIINNVNFSNKPDKKRNGSDVDVKNLTQTFSRIDFTVVVRKDCSASEMVSIAEEFASKDHSRFDCFVFIVLSHGEEDCVSGVDNNLVQIEDLRRKFRGNNVPSLLTKPKWFVIQACQGEEFTQHVRVPLDMNNLARDSCSTDIYENDDTDWVVWIGATPGRLSWRSPTKGSWFIGDVCHFLNDYAEAKSLSGIFEMMNLNVSQRRVRIKSEVACANYQSRHSLRRQWLLSGPPQDIQPERPKKAESKCRIS